MGTTFQLAIAMISLCLGNQIASSNHDAHASVSNALSPVDVNGPDGRPVEVVRTLPGIAQPSRHVALAAPVNGVLMRVTVREGDVVEQGQLLAVMDNRIAEAELRLAEAVSQRVANVARAERELQLADNLLARLLKVRDRHAVSELEVDQARADRDKARAVLDQTREQQIEAGIKLDLARTRLEAHNVRAPFAGRVLGIDADPGQTINSDDTLMTLVNLDHLLAELYVPIQWYEQMVPGDTFQLAASAPVHRAIRARLVVRDPVIDAATRTFRCAFEIENGDNHLPAGFAVRLVRPKDRQGVTSQIDPVVAP